MFFRSREFAIVGILEPVKPRIREYAKFGNLDSVKKWSHEHAEAWNLELSMARTSENGRFENLSRTEFGSQVRGRVLTVKIRQPSHEFTFGVGMTFVSCSLVLTPVV
jgi:hypothetical protein